MDYSSLPVRYTADIVICGGGTAGAFAAIAAAQEGKDVLVIEQFGMVGGSATAALVTPVMHSHIEGDPPCSYISEEVRKRLLALGACDESGRDFDTTMLKVVLEQMCVEAGVRLLYYTFMPDVVVKDGKVEAVVIANKAGLSLVKGKIFIDCTGDGDISVRAGANYTSGNPETGKNQAISLRYIMEGVDTKALGEYLTGIMEKYGVRQGTVVTKDGHGAYMHINYKQQCPLNYVFNEAVEAGDVPEDDRRYWQAFSVPGRPGCFAFNTPEFFDFIDGTNPDHLTLAQINGKKRILGQMQFYRKYFKGFDNAHLCEIATQIGVRETREIETDYVLTAKDLFTHTKFADTICQSNYPVDVHGMHLENDYLDAMADDGMPWYDVPFRSLVVKGIDNLMVAGRCMGAEFFAEASIRVQQTARATGEAAGIGAAMALEKGISPHEVDGVQVREKMVEKGARFAAKP